MLPLSSPFPPKKKHLVRSVTKLPHDFVPISTLIRVSIIVIKHHGQIHCGEEKVYFILKLIVHHSSQGRNRRQELKQKQRGMLFTCLQLPRRQMVQGQWERPAAASSVSTACKTSIIAHDRGVLACKRACVHACAGVCMGCRPVDQYLWRLACVFPCCKYIHVWLEGEWVTGIVTADSIQSPSWSLSDVLSLILCALWDFRRVCLPADSSLGETLLAY